MTNGNDSAFQNQTFSPNSEAGFRESESLTKREYFAAMAMQGLLAGDTTDFDAVTIAAVEQADALIEALNKEPA